MRSIQIKLLKNTLRFIVGVTTLLSVLFFYPRRIHYARLAIWSIC